jgi:signal transduction histidine kinase
MPGPRLLGPAGLDAAARQRRLAFLDITAQDEANLAAVREFARAHVDEIVDAFYEHLERFAETRQLLGSHGPVGRLKQLQRSYFLRLLEGRFDEAYFESRLRVGNAHQLIDLHPEWYLGTYNLYLRLVIDRLREHYRDDPDRLLCTIESLSKVIFLDMGLAIDAYIMGGFVERALAAEYRRVAEVAQRTVIEKEGIERRKTDLTNMIVHDLKAPIGGILTVTQLALRKRGAGAEAQARHFEQIQRSARDLLRMIENLLEIDQMQEDRLELRIEPVDLGVLCSECAAEFHAAANLANQQIVVAVREDVPIIATDMWLLRRVLNNLVVNAIRHSGGPGTIALEADLVDGAVQVRVRDSGRGIPEEEQALLFVKDRRRSQRDHREDTGLGLVFCKMAVEIMGGTIAVHSRLGHGTTFVVTLPA